MQSLFDRLLRRRNLRLMEPDLGRTLAWTALWLTVIVFLHIAAMMAIEGMSARQALWFTAVTITTTGYGDITPASDAGRLATTVLVFAGGIFVLAKFVGDYTEWAALQVDRRLSGRWSWTMRDHLVIIGAPSSNPDLYFTTLVGQLRHDRAWREVPVVLLTRAFAGERLPTGLTDLSVVHRTGGVENTNDLAAVSITAARAVLILCPRQGDATADASVFDAIDRVREVSPAVRIVAEYAVEASRRRMLRAGAGQAIRAMHGFPEQAARALTNPGAEQVLEELYTAQGEECRRYDLSTPYVGSWAALAAALIGAEIGTPLGYAAADGAVRANPNGSVQAHTLFVVVHDDNEAEATEAIHRIIAALRGSAGDSRGSDRAADRVLAAERTSVR